MLINPATVIHLSNKGKKKNQRSTGTAFTHCSYVSSAIKQACNTKKKPKYLDEKRPSQGTPADSTKMVQDSHWLTAIAQSRLLRLQPHSKHLSPETDQNDSKKSSPKMQ